MSTTKNTILERAEFEVSPEMKFVMKEQSSFILPSSVGESLSDIPIKFLYSKDLLPVLGHDGNGFNGPINLNQEYTSLYVYCDAVYPTIIGDKTGNLLRVVNVDNSVPFGTTVTKIFEEPYYVKLAHHSFQELAVFIRTDTGKPPHFEFGRDVITLHFKRQT